MGILAINQITQRGFFLEQLVNEVIFVEDIHVIVIVDLAYDKKRCSELICFVSRHGN